MTQKVAHKIEGKFYPLQKEELLNLRKVKLINNIAFVHFALKYENPFCDRPVAVTIKEFALRWSIPEGSLYKALAKLKELGIIKFNSGKVTIEWVNDSQSGEIIEVDNEFSDRRKNSQIGEKILRSEKRKP